MKNYTNDSNRRVRLYYRIFIIKKKTTTQRKRHLLSTTGKFSETFEKN